MPLSKRKRQNGDDCSETTRRVTRHASNPTKPVRRGRRALKKSDNVDPVVEEEAEEEVRTTRSRARQKEDIDSKPGQQRTLRRTVVENTVIPKRRTRQAVRDTEIADSDDVADDDEADDDEADDDEEEDAEDEEANDDDDDDDEEKDDDDAASQDSQDHSIPDSEPSDRQDSSDASPPHTRQWKKADAASASASANVVSPLTPPHIAATAIPAPVVGPFQPRRETTIKPPFVPSMATTATAPPPARPKKVTEIKPPAVPAKATPIQAPAPRSQAKPTVTPITAPTTASRPTTTTTPASTSASATATANASPRSPSQPDRNIDKVVLGEICFKAWYPSYYGKEVLGDTAGNSHHHGRGGHASKGQSGKENHASGGHGGPSGKNNSSHAGGAGHHKESTPMLDRLYVCPFCFKYSREIVPWHGHVQVCESQFQIPGEKVYVHPKGVRTIRVPIVPPATAAVRGGGSKRRTPSSGGGGGSTSAPSAVPATASTSENDYVEQTVADEGEWSVWEVDGERDVLFCQNISLFAKLFLDTKSVFFDVLGFKYFLLVYTPPPSLPSSLRAAATATLSSMRTGSGGGGSGSGNGAGQPPASILGGAAPRPRVVGFFSKEKLSWDNNNLACILVFPPWQRKGLGALLMGLSYEIARREGVLGGPEKPISDLGKRGYRRFWAGEIARWLLGLDVGVAASDTGNSESDSSSLVIDIDDCSAATWIVRDDCLYVLREMGLVEDAGMGPPKRFCEHVLPPPLVVAAAAASSGEGDDALGGAAAASAASAASAAAATDALTAPPETAARAPSAEAEPVPQVKRVRLSKAAVRQWAADNRISLERTCDPAGFLKDYTPKEAAVED